VRHWIDKHPFVAAVIVIMLMVIPGLLRIEQVASDARKAAASAKATADTNRRVALRNEQTVQCITEWVQDETAALRSRDAIADTWRGAAEQLWEEIQKWLSVQPPPPGDRTRARLVDAIADHREILDRLTRRDIANPYPKIQQCLDEPINTNLTFQQIGLFGGYRTCLGRGVTIPGGPGTDTLSGSDHADSIRSYRERDLISANGGKDRLCGGKGDDVLNGGHGFDRANGGRGHDVCVQIERARSC